MACPEEFTHCRSINLFFTMFAVSQDVTKIAKASTTLSPTVESGTDRENIDPPKPCKSGWRLWKLPIFRKKGVEPNVRLQTSQPERDSSDDSDIPNVGSNSFVVITVTTVDAADDPPIETASPSTFGSKSTRKLVKEKVNPSQQDSCLWLGNCLFLE
jgi:hypothetical protein